MPEQNTRDRSKRKGSLLSLAGLRGQPSEPHAATADAAERHRLARSRREAAAGPLVAALARPPKRPADDQTFSSEERELRAIFADGGEQAAHRGAASVASAPVVPAPAGRDRMPVQMSRLESPPPDDGEDPYWKPLIDPMKVIGGVLKSRWIILATTVCGALLGAAIALSTPKIYQARAELLVDPRDLRIIERDLTGGGLPSDATLAIVENQVKVLTSGSVLSKVVDKLGLDKDPEFNGQAKGGIGAIVSSLRSLISSGSGMAGGADNRRALSIEHLYEVVDVERGGKTFVISIRATTESAEKSALIANTLTDVFLETYGAIQSGTAGRASDELTSRLEELRSGLEDAERKVEAFKSQNDIVDAQGRLITDDEIVKLNDQLATARARTLELDARASSARDASVDTLLTGNLPEQMNSPVLTELRSQFSALKQQADRLAAKLGPRHPERLAVDAQVAAARDQIRAELRLVASSIQVDLKRAVQLEQELAVRLAQLKARQAGLSEELVTLRELEREATAKRAVYEAFLLRARETGEQRDINTANMSVISAATPPLDPTGMSRTSMTIVATMLGFAAGIGIGATRGAVESLRENGRRQPPPRPPQARPTLRPARREDRDPESAPEPAPVENAAPANSAFQHEHGAAAAAAAAEEARMNQMQPHAGWQPAAAPERPFQPQPPAWPPAQGWAEPMPQQAPVWQGWPQDPRQQPAYPAAPGYAPQAYAHYPQPPQPAYPQPPAYAWRPAAPAYGPDPAYYGYPPAMPPQAGWAQQPGPQQAMPQHYGHAQPAPHQPQPAGYPPASAPERHEAQVRTAEAESDRSAIAEIRESLREFREALRDLADQRGRRRFL